MTQEKKGRHNGKGKRERKDQDTCQRHWSVLNTLPRLTYSLCEYSYYSDADINTVFVSHYGRNNKPGLGV